MDKYAAFVRTNAMAGKRLFPIINTLFKTYPETVLLVAQTGKVPFIKSLGFVCIGNKVKPALLNNLNNSLTVSNAIVNKTKKNTIITSSLDRPLIDSCVDTPESENVEYKQSFNSCSYDKLGETIVAIANSGGGKLVWGVRDDLLIVGVDNDYGLWDKHCLHIVEVLKRCCAPNVPDIKFTDQRLSGKRNIYHVTIAPSHEMLSFNGIEVTRMSASNCVSKECKWVKIDEFNSLKQKINVMKEENNSLVIMLQQFVAKSNKK
jgi:hypothetical protein